MAENPRAPRLRLRTEAIRQSAPSPYNPYAGGGFAVIPRRGISRGVLDGAKRFECIARENPLRLLTILPDVHPSVGLALWNALRLTCAPGGMRIEAVKDGEISEDGTAAIEKLWQSQPCEIGGLIGLQTQLMQQALLTGLICLEAVPARRMQGVSQLWPVDSLTILFHRDPATTEVKPCQMQWLRKPGQQTFQGFTELDPATFYWAAVDPMVDEPYGRAPYATAAIEVICDLAMMQDLRDAVHHNAWPRTAHGFNFTEMHRVAVEVYGMTAEDAAKWVQEQFQQVVEAISNLNPDDNLAYDAAGDLKVLEPGRAFSAIPKVLEFLRQRLTQSLKTLPTLMGINDGSTQTYTTVEWAIYAAGLESCRWLIADVLRRAAQLHLQLLGRDETAVVKVEPIRTSDGYIEAQAEGLRIANEERKVLNGWTSREEAAISITGSGTVGAPLPGSVFASAPSAA